MSLFTSLSPGVETREIDLSQVIPNVGASAGAMVGRFVWGPVEEPSKVADENALVAQFGKPNDDNFVDWFSAGNFLAYTGDLTVVRIEDPNEAKNAVSDNKTARLIKNDKHATLVGTDVSVDFCFSARYPGDIANGLEVHIADSSTFADWEYAEFFDLSPETSRSASEVGAVNDEMHIAVVDTTGKLSGIPGSILETFAYVSKAKDGKDENNAKNYYVEAINRESRYIRAFAKITASDDYVDDRDFAKITDVQIDEGSVTNTSGTWSLTQETVQVVFEGPKTVGGTPNAAGRTARAVAYVDSTGKITSIEVTDPGEGYENATPPRLSVINPGNGNEMAGQDSIIMFDVTVGTKTTVTGANLADVGDTLVNPATGAGRVFGSIDAGGVSLIKTLNGGALSQDYEADEYIRGLQTLQNEEEVDISLLFMSNSGGVANFRPVTQWAIDNLAERRKDLVVFFSPRLHSVLGMEQGVAAQNVVNDRDLVGRSSSFAVMDSGWKMMYDVYNDKYRWIPLNSDIAGICARVDSERDPWWSPGGYNRGQVKNVVSLAWVPNKQARDTMYKVGINPVVTFKTDGTILYGDKTLQGKSSAFSYIGIRRLFILLRKAISNAAKYYLFEFNDEFTRASFKAMVEPYLRAIQGRRGMHSFHVECSEINNTPEVIMRGGFVGDIYIKPNYSINNIQLNFVAVRRDVAFEEVIGSF